MSNPYKDDLRFLSYQQERISHWDFIADNFQTFRSLSGQYYHQRINQLYQWMVPPGKRILEIGCGTGDLLASLQPDHGVGIDFSSGMINIAQERHPELHFVQGDAHELQLDGSFDFIILSDVINDLWDVQAVFEQLQALITPSSRILINYYSRLWEMPLKAAAGLKRAHPHLYQNWLTPEDVQNLLYLAGFEVIRRSQEIMLPFPLPLITPFFNRFLVRLWPFKHLALTNFTMARPRPSPREEDNLPLVTVVVPARNEAGNIRAIFERVPEMGRGTELIFVEGHSSDNTFETIESVMKEYPQRPARLMRQTGKGKGDAVRLGYNEASGDILMILDADLTVPPEDLPRFYDAIVSGKGDFINGVRLIYPMEKDAMRFFNFLGNKAFSLIFTWLLGQPIKDSLCGTKVLWKSDYDNLAANRSYFGDFDPFGDFDLLFGAAKLNLKIVDLPVRYRERTYGDTNIQRWKHGWLLLRMVIFAARRLKFI